MAGTPEKFTLSMTAQQVQEALLSVSNKVDNSLLTNTLISAPDNSIPTSLAVNNALEVISGDFSSLGSLSTKDTIELNSEDTSGTLPISKGGTGATTKQAAQTALGIVDEEGINALISEAIPEIETIDLESEKVENKLPVEHGGTGSSTQAGARLNLGVDSKIEVNEKILSSVCRIYGGTFAGYFQLGFVIESFTEYGTDSEGNIWKYTGNIFPYSVGAGLDPSTSGDFEVIQYAPTIVGGRFMSETMPFANLDQGSEWFIPSTNQTFLYYEQPDGSSSWIEDSASSDDLSTIAISSPGGYTIEDFIKSFELKIFQSPTNGDLTEIQTRTSSAGEVFEVRKTSDDSLATIYSDAAGATEIVQDGTDNKSGSDGVVEFYIADGDYYVEVGGVKSNFNNYKEPLVSQNIKNFGAKVDGVTVDDEAITLARQSNSRSLVYIPIGSCISDLTTHQKYTGEGRVYKSNGEPNRSFIHVAQGDTEKDSVPVSCIVRRNDLSSDWYFIDDSGHTPNGFASVSIDETMKRLECYFSFTAAKIHSIFCDPDGWYSAQGITTGIGVSTSKMWIDFFKDFAININNQAPNVGASEFSSYFADDKVTVSLSNGVITVTHPPVKAGSQFPVLSMGDLSSVSGQRPKLRAYTTTSFSYGMYANMSGTLQYSTPWIVSTEAVAKPTVSTDGGDGFIITHETTRNYGLQVTPFVDSPYIVSSTPIDRNNTRVVFRDFTGAIVNTPNSNMKIYYQSASDVLQSVPYGNVMATRPQAQVDPEDLFSNIGNFWIGGNMQV